MTVRRKCIIYHDNKYKDHWDVFITLILCFSCCVIPFRIAFENDEIKTWTILMLSFDGLFFVDVLVNFSTSFYDEEFKEIDQYKSIAKRYVQGWFFIDIVAIFPFEAILKSSDINGLIRFAKIGKIYRLVKLTRLIRVFKILL